MGAGFHGGFGPTKGFQSNAKPKLKMNLQLFASSGPISMSGNVTEKSISDYREFFFGKSVQEIEKYLNRRGYQTKIKPSKNPDSKAKVITVLNNTHERNITQVLVSPGSKRHGEVPYVKISTDNGRYKVINSRPEDYKTDGKEKAKLIFRRYW